MINNTDQIQQSSSNENQEEKTQSEEQQQQQEEEEKDKNSNDGQNEENSNEEQQQMENNLLFRRLNLKEIIYQLPELNEDEKDLLINYLLKKDEKMKNKEQNNYSIIMRSIWNHAFGLKQISICFYKEKEMRMCREIRLQDIFKFEKQEKADEKTSERIKNFVLRYYNFCYDFYEFDEKKLQLANLVFEKFTQKCCSLYWDEQEKKIKNITKIYWMQIKDEVVQKLSRPKKSFLQWKRQQLHFFTSDNTFISIVGKNRINKMIKKVQNKQEKEELSNLYQKYREERDQFAKLITEKKVFPLNFNFEIPKKQQTSQQQQEQQQQQQQQQGNQQKKDDLIQKEDKEKSQTDKNQSQQQEEKKDK